MLVVTSLNKFYIKIQFYFVSIEKKSNFMNSLKNIDFVNKLYERVLFLYYEKEQFRNKMIFKIIILIGFFKMKRCCLVKYNQIFFFLFSW